MLGNVRLFHCRGQSFLFEIDVGQKENLLCCSSFCCCFQIYSFCVYNLSFRLSQGIQATAIRRWKKVKARSFHLSFVKRLPVSPKAIQKQKKPLWNAWCRCNKMHKRLWSSAKKFKVVVYFHSPTFQLQFCYFKLLGKARFSYDISFSSLAFDAAGVLKRRRDERERK